MEWTKKIISVSIILACIVTLAFVSQKMFFDIKIDDQDSAIASESSIEADSNLELEPEKVTKIEDEGPKTIPIINPESNSSSTTTVKAIPTPASNQTDLEKKALYFWESEYSRLKNLKSSSDFAMYMSEEYPETAEMFEYTTPEENASLFADFQKSFNEVINVIEQPGTKLTIMHSDSFYTYSTYSLEYSNPDNVITIFLKIADSGQDIAPILGIQLNGQDFYLANQQLWDEIRNKSDERYYKTLN